MGSGPTPLLTEVTIIAIGVWKVDLQTKVCEDFSNTEKAQRVFSLS